MVEFTTFVEPGKYEIRFRTEHYEDYREMEEAARAIIDRRTAPPEMRKGLQPDIYGDGYDDNGNLIYDTYVCPSCHAGYEIDYEKYDYCPSCGQKFDWSNWGEVMPDA